jgi:hypothetical protein
LIDKLEWTGASLGVAGWFGVRALGNHDAQLFGFSVWVISGIILVLWAHRENKKGVMAVNAVNVVMAVSALFALL